MTRTSPPRGARARRRAPFALRLELLEDRCLPTAYTVTTTKDLLGDTAPGELTLRDALTAISSQAPSGNAPAGGASNTVSFAVGAPGSTQTISLSMALGALPAVTHQVLLDGWSQGGAGYSGPPLIVLNGTNAGVNADGLVLVAGSDGSVVRGLVLQGFGVHSGSAGNGLVLRGTSGNLVEGDYVGTDSTGTQPVGNSFGVLLEGGATNNTVGGTAAGAGNLISGNSVVGINIRDAGTTGNVVEGNRIGTDVTGTAPLGNGSIGVNVDGPANTVGGTAAGAGNVISGNPDAGVFQDLGGNGVLVEGNRIGTDRTGTRVLGHNVVGVSLEGAGSTVVGNVISGSTNSGIILVGPSVGGPVAVHFNRIVGNAIGLNNLTTVPVDATNNFWGSNAGPRGPGSDGVSGQATFDPWLVLQVTASPASVPEGGVATVVADLTRNSAGADTSAQGHLPDGIPVSFATTAGTIAPATGLTVAGKATAELTAARTVGAVTVSATVDNQTSTAALTVTRSAATAGAFDPATQTWYLRGSNSAGPPAAGQFRFGTATSVPVSGDWAGTNAGGVGVFDQTTATWYLRNEASAGAPDAGQFRFGGAGWLPVAGDWQGSGHAGVGAFDPATATWYLRNEDGAGAPDAGQFAFGVAGGVPVVGDWTGTGHLGIGVFDPATATWYLRSSLTAGAPDVGIFHFGGAGWRPVAGDWTGAGHAGIGVFDPSTATWYLRNEASAGAPDAGQFAFGGSGWLPVSGAFSTGGTGASPLAAEQLGSAVAALLGGQKHDGP